MEEILFCILEIILGSVVVGAMLFTGCALCACRESKASNKTWKEELFGEDE